jgi:hypothetical protein
MRHDAMPARHPRGMMCSARTSGWQLAATWQPVVSPNGAFRGEQVLGYFGGKVADFAGIF